MCMRVQARGRCVCGCVWRPEVDVCVDAGAGQRPMCVWMRVEAGGRCMCGCVWRSEVDVCVDLCGGWRPFSITLSLCLFLTISKKSYLKRQMTPQEPECSRAASPHFTEAESLTESLVPTDRAALAAQGAKDLPLSFTQS